MGPMDAFEQQLTRVATQVAGPVRPVDAMGVVRSAKARPVGHWATLARWFGGGATTRSERGFSMFSALKFVAAGAIVALFGGFLLTGVLTTPQEGEVPPAAVTESPSPMTTEELLTGMAVEEVEPGVYRVVNDGVRDISLAVGWGSPGHMVDVTPDGSVWLSVQEGGRGLFRLGEEPRFRDVEAFPRYREVAPDGSLWGLGEVSDDRPGILSFDGEDWTAWATTTDRLSTLAVGPDGTVWVVAIPCTDIEDGDCSGTALLRLEDDGSLTTIEDWADVYDGDVSPYQLAVSPDGDVWLIGEGRVLLRFDGEGWEAIPGPEGWETIQGPERWEVIPGPEGLNPGHMGRYLDFGPDGMLWVKANATGDLARFDDPGWTTFAAADGVTGWDATGWFGTDLLDVAADGSLWLNGSRTGEACGGTAHFQGTTWTSYLVGSCTHDFAIAPDGSVWLVADEGGRHSLYVITPEAMTASQATDTKVSTTTTSDILPGVVLIVEEVESGVFRVASDGVRDLEQVRMTVAGDDGSVWMDSARGIFELGRPGEHPGTVDSERFMAVAEDGTLWAASVEEPEGLRSFHDETWTQRGTIPEGTASVPDPWWPADYISDFAVHPDGTVWQVAEQTGHHAYTRVQHLGTDTWTTYAIGDGLPDPGCTMDCGESWQIEITPDGMVWLAVTDGGLLRFDGTDWEVVRPLGGDEDHTVVGLLGDRSGVLWAKIETGHLARFDGQAWEVFSDVPAGYLHAADPDGNLWVSSYSERDHDIAGDRCDGVRRFDRSTWTTFLPGMCVADIDIASDGSVWMRVPSYRGGIYVITPEVVAASE